jgi:hypothetical protein
VPTTEESKGADYGAARWITLPSTKAITIRHGELVWLFVGIDVPLDTTGGSNYAAVIATTSNPETIVSTSKDAPATRTEVRRSVAVQIFLDIPGDVTRGGKVTDVRSPRVVWWDGLGGGDLPVLKRLRGLGIAPIRFTWKNTGSFTDKIGGKVKIESDLGGKDVASLDFPDTAVLRSSERDFETTWSKDIPFIGRFTPTIEVIGSDGRTVTTELDPIWVIPAWWYFALLALAIGLPIWWRRRSQRKLDALYARLEAAESRADGDGFGADDAEWDEPR